MTDDVTLRPAMRGDCRTIAELFRISSDGLVDYIWGRLAEPGETLLDVGQRRYARENTAFSYQNCRMAERDGAVVGMLHSFLVDARSEPEEDPVLRPYSELEVVGSLYVAGLAVFPAHRGRGIGTRMLGAARERARELGAGEVSLLVFNANRGAVRLYERQGFRAVDRRPIVPHPVLRHAAGDVVLMTVPV